MSERCSLEPTREGTDLVVRWERATEALERARSAKNSAECEASNAETALGKWLLPKDAQPGEVFMVAYGSRWLVVEAPAPGKDPRVKWRKGGERRPVTGEGGERG